MELSFGSLLNPIIDLVSLVIISLAIYSVRRQELSQYRDGKIMLLLVYYSFLVIVALDLLATFYPTTQVIGIDVVLGTSLILADPVLLSAFSYIIYVRPTEQHFRDRLKAILGQRLVPHGILLLSYAAYVACVISYLILFEPFTTVTLVNLAGFPTASAQYSSNFLVLVPPITAFFLAYPCTQLLLAARKSTDKSVKQSLRIFTVGWIVIALSLLIFNGYLLTLGYETTALGFLIIATSLSASVVVFRRASALEEFFQPSIRVVPVVHPFSKRIGAKEPSTQGKVMLLEVDPSVKYEQAVQDFAVEQISNGSSFFVFTSKGSPTWSALSKVPEVRFFFMTRGVSYPKPTGRSFEMLVPQNDPAVLLDVLEKTLTSNPQSRIGLAFDSISDLVQYYEFEKLYKFLKQIIEMISQPRLTALFLFIAGAHDEKVRNSVMSLFGSQLVFDSSGLRMTK